MQGSMSLFLSFIEHESDLPIGYGLGSSGSAALSLSYALNHALKTNLTKTQVPRLHIMLISFVKLDLEQ